MKKLPPKTLRATLLLLVCSVVLALIWGVATLITLSVTPDTMDVMFIISVSLFIGFVLGDNHGKE